MVFLINKLILHDFIIISLDKLIYNKIIKHCIVNIDKTLVLLKSTVLDIFIPASTGSDNSNNTAVTTTAHPNKANLCSLIPGLLMFSIVVMKFNAPNKLLIPDKCSAKIAKSTLGPL